MELREQLEEKDLASSSALSLEERMEVPWKKGILDLPRLKMLLKTLQNSQEPKRASE